MSTLFANRRLRRQLTAYVVLLVASLVLLLISGNPLVREVQDGVAFAFRPVQQTVDGIANGVRSIGTTIAEIDQLRLDNEALRAENQRLEEESRGAAELRRENELLTGLLQLRNGLEFQTKAASVIARDTADARRIVLIDRGTEDGLAVGQVVMSTGGALVGRVVDVTSNSAKVVLISDSTSTVIGQLLSSAATGKVVGQLGGALVMSDIDAAAKAPVGDEVFTAGISLGPNARSPYPKGLLIGRVVDVTRDPNEVVQTAFLEPAAPLDELEFVLVITDYQGGITGPVESQGPCDLTNGGTLPDSDQPCASGAPAPTGSPKP